MSADGVNEWGRAGKGEDGGVLNGQGVDEEEQESRLICALPSVPSKAQVGSTYRSERRRIRS
jgi:hypothetical protein